MYANGQPPDYVYRDPYYDGYYDPEQTLETIDPRERTEQYVHSQDPEFGPFSPDHGHHHHHHNSETSAPPLTIRRHTPGSNDPSLQRYPTNLQAPSISDNITSSSNVRVTIKRNPPELVQPIIQPVLYPVAVYVNNPSIPQDFELQPVEVMQPIEQVQPITKPPSPKKPITPVKKSPTPSPSPTRYETETFPLPSSRNIRSNISSRRPIRTDLITPTPTPPKIEPQRIQSAQMIVEEYDTHNDYYRVPSVYTVPKKVISYRTAPGLTTRELENDKIDETGRPVYIQSRDAQTVTYRNS
jgi:hypothetical protein